MPENKNIEKQEKLEIIDKTLEDFSKQKKHELPNGPEKITSPDQGQEDNKKLSEIQESKSQGGLAGVSIAGAVTHDYKEREKKIEEVLAHDLESAYLNMDESSQKKFKIKGEETAEQINKLLGKTKTKIKKVIALIIKWLILIPGVNKFFIEQEAKIKADEIIKLKPRD